MAGRKALVYYAWSKPLEAAAPLDVIEDRFPTLFETRRMLYPRFAELADPTRFDQGAEGFLDHVMAGNFTAFIEHAGALLGEPVNEVERASGTGDCVRLDDRLLEPFDTVVVISFDSVRTFQTADDGEVEAVRRFLARPDNLLFLCPHHDIGDAAKLPDAERQERQLEDFLHHGDRTIPPRQQFGGFARSLLAGLGVPVVNRFGLRPAAEPDGSPSPVEVEAAHDHLGLLAGVRALNLHPHLPHLERLGDARTKLDVLVRQRIDPTAPPHRFARDRATFDALLQSRPNVFAGTLLVGDATLWSSTAGGTDNLRRLWTNVVTRPVRSMSAKPKLLPSVARGDTVRSEILPHTTARLRDRQRAFAEALLDPVRPVPQGLAGPDGVPSAKRFAVYRNNVVAGLIGTLKDAYPAVLRIVGEEFFSAMARIYVARQPPTSPIMLDYGAGFADFIRTFEPASALPYLGDVARLERAWMEAYHAAEAIPIDPESLGAVAADRIPGIQLALHPSVRVVRSPFPVVDIWQMNVGDGHPHAIYIQGHGEDALVARPAAVVEVRVLPGGAATFVDALAAGRTVVDAVRASLGETPGFNLAGTIAGLLGAGALAGWSDHDGFHEPNGSPA